MKKLAGKILGFWRSDERGSLSVEAIFAFPMLIFFLIALYVFFDAFKAQNTSYRANYTISDMLSRQTDPVDQNFLNGLDKVFRFMTHAGPENSWIRVSVVRCTANCTDENSRQLSWVWSHGTNGARSLGANDITFYKSKIPLFAYGDRLIFVETSRQYFPPFTNPLFTFAGRDLVSFTVTRPRFAPQLLWHS